jgi:hypothetical protein
VPARGGGSVKPVRGGGRRLEEWRSVPVPGGGEAVSAALKRGGRRPVPATSGGATAGAWRRGGRRPVPALGGGAALAGVGGSGGAWTGRQRRRVDREAVTLGWAKATRPRLYWEAAEGVGGGRE